MKERSRFVVEQESGRYAMAELCRIFGISRETGYKWVERYEAGGPAGLADRAPEILPKDHLEIRFEVTGDSERRLTFKACGPRAECMLETLR